MKYMLLTLLLLVATTAQSADLFRPWCDEFTAEGLASVTANFAFGHVSDLTAAQAKARTAWYQQTIDAAQARFKRRTGRDFATVDDNRPGDWISRCQTADQVTF